MANQKLLAQDFDDFKQLTDFALSIRYPDDPLKEGEEYYTKFGEFLGISSGAVYKQIFKPVDKDPSISKKSFDTFCKNYEASIKILTDEKQKADYSRNYSKAYKKQKNAFPKFRIMYSEWKERMLAEFTIKKAKKKTASQTKSETNALRFFVDSVWEIFLKRHGHIYRQIITFGPQIRNFKLSVTIQMTYEQLPWEGTATLDKTGERLIIDADVRKDTHSYPTRITCKVSDLARDITLCTGTISYPELVMNKDNGNAVVLRLYFRNASTENEIEIPKATPDFLVNKRITSFLMHFQSVEIPREQIVISLDHLDQILYLNGPVKHRQMQLNQTSYTIKIYPSERYNPPKKLIATLLFFFIDEKGDFIAKLDLVFPNMDVKVIYGEVTITMDAHGEAISIFFKPQQDHSESEYKDIRISLAFYDKEAKHFTGSLSIDPTSLKRITPIWRIEGFLQENKLPGRWLEKNSNKDVI